MCTHLQGRARQIKSRELDLKQSYHNTRSASAAQCEILGTSLHPRHPTCTATLAQQSSICLINLDSFVGVTVLYSAETFQVIWCFRHKMTLSRWKKKSFPALESSFFNKYLCGTLQRNKPHFLLIAKLIHLAISLLQASGGGFYFQTFIQFPEFPNQNHCPGAIVTYYFCFIAFSCLCFLPRVVLFIGRWAYYTD